MPSSDCELIGDGLFGQPVNSLTTVAFLIGGALLLRRPRLRWVGFALIATGVGSFLFHGPMPPGSEWAHDASLAWLILVVGGLGQRWESWTRLPGLAVLDVLFALAPGTADPIAVTLVVAAGIIVLRSDRSPRTIGALVGLGGVAIFGRLGATGGPLCDPQSVFQPHGVWHIGAAAIVTWWVMGYRDVNEVVGS